MSRSFKKTPIIKDNGHGKKGQKKDANSSFRMKLKQDDEEQSVVANGKAYRKTYNQWKMVDWKILKTEDDARREYVRLTTPETYVVDHASVEFCQEMVDDFKKRYPTIDRFINKWWKKYYKRK